WQDAKVKLEQEKQVAATMGLDSIKVAKEYNQKISRQIYDAEAYYEEEQFYNKVVQIMESKETVVNPLALLADADLIANMTEYEKQSYLVKLSGRFQRAVEKYKSSGANVI
ncbi:MAG: hypothetical protein NC350_05470, partial [Corallococcus sp.]|nr:hypothetical protein [Corallococcus sp.]